MKIREQSKSTTNLIACFPAADEHVVREELHGCRRKGVKKLFAQLGFHFSRTGEAEASPPSVTIVYKALHADTNVLYVLTGVHRFGLKEPKSSDQLGASKD